MRYVINISGWHGSHGNAEEALDAEYGAARLAHELVTKLDGVQVASFGGSHYHHPDLKTEPEPPRRIGVMPPRGDVTPREGLTP